MSNFSLVVMASGQGTNFTALVEAIRQNRIPAQMVGLVVNNPQAKVCDRAKALGVPVRCVDHRQFDSYLSWDKELAKVLGEFAPDMIVLAGFLQKIGPEVLSRFSGKMLNTHPSLLPAYGGAGMYGSKIHRAVIAAGEVVSGVSVHKVTEDYDSGPMLAQVAIRVAPNDTAEDLEVKIKNLEHEFLVDVVEKTVKATLSENN